MRSVNCFQTVVCILFAVTVHGYVTNIHTTSSAWKKVDNSEHKYFNRHVKVINQSETVKLASGIFSVFSQALLI